MAKLASKGSSSLTLSWNMVAGADGYDILLAKDGKKSPVVHAYTSGGTKSYTNAKRVTVKKKGTCYVYVYAQNGVYKKVKIFIYVIPPEFQYVVS